MVNIGRNNIRSRMTPNPQGLARRVDTKLDGVVDAYAARFKAALAVDGVTCFIFNKHRGNIPCTCRGFQNLNGFASHEIGLTGYETQQGNIQLQADGKTRTANTYATSFGQVQEVGSLTATTLDDLFKQNNETIVEKIEGVDPDDENNDDGFINDPNPDILDAMNAEDGSDAFIYAGDGDPLKQLLTGTDLENSTDFPFSSGMVACPICYGAGTVDSWRLYNGDRTVLDASTMYTLDVFNGAEVDSSTQPAVFSVYPRSSVQWSNVSIPTSWRYLMRLALFNRGKEVPTTDYNFFFIHPSQPTVKNPLNYETLSLLNNSALLQQGNKLKFIIESNLDDDYPLVFTHMEILFSTGELVYMQVPPAEVANEDEFVDWNLNVTFEVASDVEIRENSYIIDGKYKRVWKVTSNDRKLTAQGKSFGYSVSVRSIHSFERQYSLMNVFRKVLDPWRSRTEKDSIADDF